MTAFNAQRRTALALLGAAALAPKTTIAWAESSPRPGSRVFIDANQGDDRRDGLSPDAALKTLDAAYASGRRPSWIGLARNSRFPGSLRVASPLIVEAYGTGSAPVIDAGLSLRDDDWVEGPGGGIWSHPVRLAQVEALLVNSERMPKVASLTSSNAPGSWAWIGGRLHVRANRHPREAFASLVALNRSCIAIDGADDTAIIGVTAAFGVHGIVGQRSKNVRIVNSAALNCAANGFYLADDTAGWSLANCVAEHNGGAGFAFNYGAARSVVQKSRGNRNGIDGCQFSEGCGTDNALIDCEFRENAIAGVNCKEKHQRIVRCRMIDNGEAGVIAQVNTDVLEMTDSVLSGNNRADNGTMNLALEDHARVVSTRNIYVGPYARQKQAVNVRLIGQSSLISLTDCFVDRAESGNIVASIRVATTTAMEVSINHASFYNTAARIGRVIDCRGAKAMTLTVSNTAIDGKSICLAYESEAKVAMDHNCYRNSDRGSIIEISGDRPLEVRPETLKDFVLAGRNDKGSIAADPRFADPERLDLSLAGDSPARGSGRTETALVDAFGVAFSSPPNIGAIAASGDLRKRLIP